MAGGRRRATLQHELVLPASDRADDDERVLVMLLCLDLTATTTDLLASALTCSRSGCTGTLRPWGYARQRRLRDGDTYRPRRSRCQSCRRTDVLAWAHSYPRRVDHVNVVSTALLAAARGLGHRKVAALVDRPPSTVRDWLRRARRNSEPVRIDATRYVYEADPVAYRFDPTGSELGDMLDAVGRGVIAATLLSGPSTAGVWQKVLIFTRAAILAPTVQPGLA